ncbi:MAG TPA: hypothetical protein VFL82_16705 [Thermomicrobiales bacterium]|nr:hypothetical protein [Thermomicrobiales bacterium]
MVSGMFHSRMHVLIGLMLAVGLIVAIATDGQLPPMATKGLLVGLLGLDGLTIHWLTTRR